jgi:cell division protein FtsI (penicillin-binding protein 3)
MDPRSGEILALADRPGFDPNRFRKVRYPSTRSRAFLDAFQPGSTLKAFLVAAALEQSTIDADEIIDCEKGFFRVPGKTIRDLRPHGSLDVGSVLRVSSNIGATKIAYRLGPEDHFEALRHFGFGRRTGSGFPDEAAGLLRSWRSWRPVDHATIAFGQGLSVTPVQLAAATAALANGGTWLPPRLVAARRRPGGVWKAVPRAEGRRSVSEKTAATVLEMMRNVVGPEGTGRRAALRDVAVAGKTGTAQKLDRETGTYAPNRYLAWFVGVVPAEDPRLAIVAVLDEPKGDAHTGGAVAAPLFARVAAAQLRHLGIVTEPGFPRVQTAATEAKPRAETKPRASTPRPRAQAAAPRPRPLARFGDRVLLPDFRGLSIPEVRKLAASTPLDVEILGRGLAVAQEPDPGTILAGSSRRVQVRFAPEGG